MASGSTNIYGFPYPVITDPVNVHEDIQGLAEEIEFILNTNFVTEDANETLTNKTINGLNNTITNISLTTAVTGTLPVANGGTGITSFGSGIATFLGTPSSSNLAAAITDETGTGALVFANSPSLVTPSLGSATATSLTTTGGSLLVREASDQDGIEIRGRAGGTGNFEIVLIPTTLTADRTITLPDQTGVLALQGFVPSGLTWGDLKNGKSA